MNATNRGLNRFILFVVGVVLLGVGVAMVLAMVWPAFTKLWSSWLPQGFEWVANATHTSRISEATTLSWFTLGVLAVFLLIVVVAVTVISRLGGGHSSVVLREEAGSGPEGAVTVRGGFAADAITQSLESHDEILTSKVNTRTLRGSDVLHVYVTPRQNVPPLDIANTVTELVDRLNTLLGRDVPTLVTIHSGIRSRLAADQSRVD